MLLRRTNGFPPVLQLRDEMDRLVGDFFGAPTGSTAARSGAAVRGYPALNIWENGDELMAEAEVPGLKSEDIDISVIANDLTIHGRRGGEPKEGTAYHRQERGQGEFTRVVRLPIDVDADRVEASLKDGILLITLPKAESAKPKKIKVNAATS